MSLSSNRAVVSGGAGGTLAPPEFGCHVNPIPTRGADYAHCITACPLGFENLVATLYYTFLPLGTPNL